MAAVVPIKELSRSKSRLGGVLSIEERTALSLGLLRRVVAAAVDSPRCARVYVVGRDAAAERAARELGAEWLDDTAGDLNGAVGFAFSHAAAEGMAPLYLPADLPFVSCEDVTALVEVSGGGSVLTLAPARFDGGTNAILAPPGTAFRPALSDGSVSDGSFGGHVKQARGLGLEIAFFDSPGLGLDVDRPGDLALAERIEPGFISRLTRR